MKNGRPVILGKFLLFTFFFFTFSFFLQAQDSSDGEIRFVQRLTWNSGIYVRHYEVVIEMEEEGEYRELMRESTTALFIEVPLLPGKYRCLVIPYNFLDQPSEASDWRYIEVLALRQEPDDILPEISLSDKKIESPVDKTGIKLDMFLSVAWMPSFTIYDEESRFFGRKLSLAGAVGHFGVVWPKWKYFNPGLELAASYSFVNNDSAEQVHLWGAALNLSALRWLSVDKMALTFRLGAGYSIDFHLNMGISFLLFIKSQQNKFGLYLETGLDYAYWFTDPPPSCFRPWVGVGWRF
jgi:hypothetical protein